ncbi:hypothetical protein J6590_070470 [Homalodisca vitripennis]|nr:hypothetical protein J6590_070470 [Homalodisca vitripennis]
MATYENIPLAGPHSPRHAGRQLVVTKSSSPPSTADVLCLFLSPYPRHFTAAHINAQLLRWHVYELTFLSLQQYDLIGISESWFKLRVQSGRRQCVKVDDMTSDWEIIYLKGATGIIILVLYYSCCT